jgi:hypothetical protein
MKRAIFVVLFLVLVALAGLLGLLALSGHDASVTANKVFGERGHVRVSLVSVHPSRKHGLWIYWRMHFPFTDKYMPGDVALWYLRPFRHVELTK